MFKQLEVGKSSIAQRKLVYGVGVNDADYQVTARIEGTKHRCPYYKRWTRMLERCYSDSRPSSYENCIVSNEWLLFSTFRDWMVQQDWDGKELDKDIRVPGNKKYSEKTCMFVSKKLNVMSLELREGVGVKKVSGGYEVQLGKNCKIEWLGSYVDKNDADRVYLTHKIGYLQEVQKDYPEIVSVLQQYLVNYMAKLATTGGPKRYTKQKRVGVTVIVNGKEFLSAGAAARYIAAETDRTNVKDISRRIRKYLASPSKVKCCIYGKYNVS